MVLGVILVARLSELNQKAAWQCGSAWRAMSAKSLTREKNHRSSLMNTHEVETPFAGNADYNEQDRK